jgi:hypothetical protein
MKKAIAIFLSLAAVACANDWFKEGVSQEDTDRDEQMCDQDGRYYAWLWHPIEPATEIDAAGRAVGRGPLPDERRLAYLCMRQKGYRLVPAKK